MQVGVLGPLDVRMNGVDVTPRGQRLRDVFAVLWQRRGRPVPAEVVLDLVWGGTGGRAQAAPTVAAVHTTVARLRRQLGADVVTSRDLGYLIQPADNDEDDFTELAGLARRQAAEGDFAAATGSYRAALKTWRGQEAFEGVRAELVEADRARLDELRVALTEELAGAILDHPGAGEPDEALVLTTSLITGHPLRERPYQLAMLAAYRCHRQAESLEIFQSLRRRLRAELGIEPAIQTTILQSQILNQDHLLNTGGSLLAGKPLSSTGRLPAPVSPLTARDVELDALLRSVAAGRRLVTLVGTGGVGKSRLLLELGARSTGSRPVLYTELSGLTETGPGELAEAVAAGQGLSTGLDPLGSLNAALGDDPWLMLIDEAEWVIDPLAVLVQSVLQACPRVQIVVTSRIPLDLIGESLIVIEPLGCPEQDADIDAIMASPAVRLLTERLADRAFVLEPGRQTADDLASIARRVDGLPLGLELAAGQSAGRNLAELAALVESPLDVPATQRLRTPRHRSLRATLDWSLTRLDPRSRAVLHRLRVFAGPFELQAARAVTAGLEIAPPDIDEIVRSLARDALLHIERTSMSRINFRLLRTVRELTGEATDPQQAKIAQALHRRWHAGLWRTAEDHLVEDVGAHLEDYLEALKSALESSDVTTLADLTITLGKFWQFAGGQSTGLRWFGTVLDSDVLDNGDRARVLAQRAVLALHHDPSLVLADTAAAIPLLESTGHTAFTVTALSVRALELLAQNRPSEATAHADLAVDIARARTPTHEVDRAELANALGSQAEVYAVIESIDRATAAIDEAIECLRSASPTLEGVMAAGSIALALVNLERFDDAVALLDGVEVPPAASPPPARFQLTLGWACLGSGDFTRALAQFLGAIPPPAEPRLADRHAAETVLGAACSLAARGDAAAAAALAGSLELLRQVDYRSPPALERAITRARSLVGDRPWPQVGSEPAAVLLDRLERDLLALAPSADSRSAVG